MSDKDEELGTIALAQPGGSLKRVDLGTFVEGFIAYQRAHYASIVAKRKREIEIKHPLWTDEERERFLQETIDHLAGDHARCIRELTAMAAGGMRTPDETLQ